MRMTPEEYKQWQERNAAKRVRPKARHKPMVMNALEQKYAAHLEQEKRAGLILDYQFERLKFRLADKTFYTPDFVVVTTAGIEIHEVKGFWEDDAKVKIKVCAEQNWWFRFMVSKAKKGNGFLRSSDMEIFMDGFKINIGGRKEAIWDGSRLRCPMCSIEVGLARYADNQETVRFSLLSNNAEPHDCGRDIDREQEGIRHEDSKRQYRTN